MSVFLATFLFTSTALIFQRTFTDSSVGAMRQCAVKNLSDDYSRQETTNVNVVVHSGFFPPYYYNRNNNNDDSIAVMILTIFSVCMTLMLTPLHYSLYCENPQTSFYIFVFSVLILSVLIYLANSNQTNGFLAVISLFLFLSIICQILAVIKLYYILHILLWGVTIFSFVMIFA